MIQKTSLAGVLFGLWLLLSGHFEPLLLGFGVASCLLVVAIAHRMDVVDHEGHPVHIGHRALLYWPWLLREIARSNVEVARLILHPKLPISPELVQVSASQRTDLGQVIYANSITLTPGTVSVELEDGKILVHALTEAGATALEAGEMDRRVAAMEGRG
ncbi:MAG: Na+/H+ antiporter subunit E [Dongiaceae bacterium]